MEITGERHTEMLFERLRDYGQEKPVEEVYKAVQTARENYREREGLWPDPASEQDWDYLVYNAVETLGLDHDLVGL